MFSPAITMAGFLLYLACEPARRFFIANTLQGFFSNLQSPHRHSGRFTYLPRGSREVY